MSPVPAGNPPGAHLVKILMQIPLPAIHPSWLPTRAEALRRAELFAPRAGRLYAAGRNFDRGPGQRENVSTLSPYIRHRIITETEVLETVLARCSLSAAEKFVQEIFWRTYWKGWLEAHPGAWGRYRSTLADQIAELETDARLRDAYARAVDAGTGIDAFDAWMRELRDCNYLHNHARMWFASIWIFTLGLPWELGADVFMRNLLDGDPASNTLSWRWVAGLHTRGKTYTATRENIRRYTEGRFEVDAVLARSAAALEDPEIPLSHRPQVPASELDGQQPSLLVLHEDDVRGDMRDTDNAGIRGVSAIRAAHARSPLAVASDVVAFSDAALGEAVTRNAEHLSTLDLGVVAATESEARFNALREAAERCGATRIIVPFAPVGPVREILDELRPRAARAQVDYVEIGRRYDAVSWPAATRGFFNVRSRIPTILAELGIGKG